MLQLKSILMFAAAVSSPASRTFAATALANKDGYRFTYSSEPGPRGTIRINGTMLDTRDQFTLSVDRTGRVDGNIGYSPVSFTVSKSVYDQVEAQLRSEQDVQLANAHPH